MGDGGRNQKSPAKLRDPLAQTGRKRFRRSKSAPVVESFTERGQQTTQNLPPPKSIFGKLHPSMRKVAIFLMFYLIVGTITFYLIRNQIKGEKTNGILDSMYFTILTMTAVGYGDLVPNSAATKLLACAFVFWGTALFCLILIKSADYLVEKQESLLIKAKNLSNNVVSLSQTNQTRYKCLTTMLLLVLLIVSGTVFLATVEKLDFVDAFYCVCGTITSLGYVDKCFSTKGGRVFAVFWILAGTICLPLFFLYIAELNTESKQKELVKWVLSKRMSNGDLEAADIDDDGVVGAAEFVLYKLKEIGKISQEDISVFVDEFENLDVDQNGSLSALDLMLAEGLK